METNAAQILLETKNKLGIKTDEEMTEEDKLLKGMVDIIENSIKLETDMSNLNDEEKFEYIKQLGESDGIDYNSMMSNGIPKTASEIIENIPVAIVEQKVNDITMEYPLANLVAVEMVRNGTKQMFYKDMKPTGNVSGFSDVKIEDYNQGRGPQFSEVLTTKTEISAGYDILSTILNDITINPALFVSIVNDYVYAISTPLAFTNYKRLLNFIDNSNNYQQIKEFTKATPAQIQKNANAQVLINAKELAENVIQWGTPSREILTLKPNGAKQNLQYRFNPKNCTIVMNSKYAVNYTYDLLANTFNMGKIVLPFGKVEILNFDTLDSTLTKTTKFLKESEILIYENGSIMDIVHYTGTKTIDTPKLKKVLVVYTKKDMFINKTRFLGRFKVAA